MRHFVRLSVTALAALVALPASAQDASQWAGFNAGIQAGFTVDGRQDYLGGGSNSYDIEGNAQGLFVGYMASFGAWALGGELAYSNTDMYETRGDEEYPEWRFSETRDLKLRVGYAVDRALIYGVVGYNWATWEEGAPDNTEDSEGALFGLGADYLVSDRVFLGGELLRRTLDTEGEFDAHATTLSVRAGIRF